MKKALPYVLIYCAFIFYACSKKEQINSSANSLNSTSSLGSQPVSSIIAPSTIAGISRYAGSASSVSLAVKSLSQGLINNVSEIRTISKNDTPYFYVVNAANDGGWVVYSADVNYKPVLAYSEAGHFDTSKISSGTANWFNVHYKNISYIRNSLLSQKDSLSKRYNRMLWANIAKKTGNSSLLQQTNPALSTLPAPPGGGSTGGSGGGSTGTGFNLDSLNTKLTIDVEPLCTTQWEQNYPYNIYCPSDGNPDSLTESSGNRGHDPTGCVPTAMAQVMYFWKSPAKYNWSAMKTLWTYTNPGDNTDCAKLMYDIGTTQVNGGNFVSYGTSVTGADMDNCVNVFSQFGYTAQLQSGLVYSAEAQFVFNEISNNQRPCLIGGFTAVSLPILGFIGHTTPQGDGHAWVCDGCRQYDTRYYYSRIVQQYVNVNGTLVLQNVEQPSITDSLHQYLHMNWGWGDGYDYFPANNGWYDCSTIYTQPTIKPGVNNFQYYQQIIYGIKPS